MNPIVMPVRLGIYITRRAAESALSQDVGDISLIAIDNGSTDGVGQYLRTLDKTVIMSYKPAKGVTYVWNKALNWLFNDLRLHHALVINNDIVLRTDAYRLLLEDGGNFVTGVGVDNPNQMESVNVQSRAPHPHFSCFLIHREVWSKIGPFDEDMVIYAQDADYHLRMEKAGFDAHSIAVPFYHETSSTLKLADTGMRDAIMRQADLDRQAFEKKWGFPVGSEQYYAEFREKHGMPYLEKGTLA